ncbi:beta-galactosidase [uncultured Kriegella sp.]|uniref:beta-galactosidase n=1 Tax=uncultured Kriegella sp. TaxID=1798910 RepID=UPI0030DB8EAF
MAKNFSGIFLIGIICAFQISSQATAQTSAKIKLTEGRPTLIIDGEAHPPFAYMSYLGEEKYYNEVADAGIHLYNIPAYLADRGINSTSGIGPFRKPIWIAENQYDFSSVIEDFDKIVTSDPYAKVIVRLYLDPPLWWERLHPEASAQLPDGSTYRQCFSSEIWKAQTGKVIEDFLEWIQESPYATILAGIHVASGFTEEWFYHPKQYHDQNPVRRDAFRQWLRNKYKKVTVFQKTWNDTAVTFETAQLANIDEAEKRKEWRDPKTEQHYIDTFRFHTEVMTDNIAYFCKIVKEKSKGKLLTGAFYGYHYFVTDPRRGHGALAKLLDCPDLDYLSSPNAYNRVLGEDWPAMAAINSVRLHGKLWLTENDTRTSITTLLRDRSHGIAPPGQYEDGVWLGPEDMETSKSFLWKNTARMLAFGYGGWWFDMWGGWFSDPELLSVLKNTQRLHSDYLPKNIERMTSEVLVVVDEELSFWDASYGSLTENILSNRYPLAKTGTSYDLFLRSDLGAISMKKYKVVWLMGLLHLNAAEEAQIAAWQNQGITVVKTDANGTEIYSNDNKPVFLDGKLKWSAADLRELWRKSEVHIYNDTSDVFYIGNNWLGIHTIKGGERTLRFPFKAQIIDPLKNKVLADSTNTLKLKLHPKSTTLLRIHP